MFGANKQGTQAAWLKLLKPSLLLAYYLISPLNRGLFCVYLFLLLPVFVAMAARTNVELWLFELERTNINCRVRTMTDIIEYWIFPNDPLLGFDTRKTVAQVASHNWSKVGRLLDPETYLYLTKASAQGGRGSHYAVSAYHTEDKEILWRQSFSEVSTALLWLNEQIH